MSVLELPRNVGPIELPPAPRTALRTAVEPPISVADAAELTDDEFAMLFRQGVKWGIPIMYAITALICLIAVPGYYPLLIAAVLPALFGGWYFGGVFAMAVRDTGRD